MLGYYALYSESMAPVRATEDSACFDLFCFLPSGKNITCFSDKNEKYEKTSEGYFTLDPGHRAKISAGISFDIPRDCSVRIHIRSGVSLKKGLTLANNEGVIDSDYVDEVFSIVTNTSSVPVRIGHGERLTQAEIVKTLDVRIAQIFKIPDKKGTRAGGFGTTGGANLTP